MFLISSPVSSRLMLVRNGIRLLGCAIALWLGVIMGYAIGNVMSQLSGVLLIWLMPELFGFLSLAKIAQPALAFASCSCSVASGYGVWLWLGPRLHLEKPE